MLHSAGIVLQTTATTTASATTGNLPHVLMSTLLLAGIVAAGLIALLPLRTRDDLGRLRVLTVCAAGISFIVTFWLVNDASSLGISSAYIETKPWLSLPFLSVTYGLSANGVVSTFLFPLNAVFVALALLRWKERAYARVGACGLLLAQSACNGAIISDDAVLMCASLLLLFGALLMFSMSGGHRNFSKYLVSGVSFGGVLLAACVYIAAATKTGSTDFLNPTLQSARYQSAVAALHGGAPLFLVTTAIFLVLMGAFPFHGWLAGFARETGGAAATVVIAVLPRVAAVVFLKWMFVVFPAESGRDGILFAVLAAANALWALGGCCATKDVKRFVAYLSQLQMSFVLLVISDPNTLSVTGAMYELCGGVLAVAGLSMLVQALDERWKVDLVFDKIGLAWDHPRFGLFFLVITACLIGAPFLPLFTADLASFAGTYPVHHALSLVVMLSIAGAVIAMARLLHALVWTDEAHEGLARVKDLSSIELSALAVLLVVIILFGIFPGHVITNLDGGISELISKAGGA